MVCAAGGLGSGAAVRLAARLEGAPPPMAGTGAAAPRCGWRRGWKAPQGQRQQRVPERGRVGRRTPAAPGDLAAFACAASAASFSSPSLFLSSDAPLPAAQQKGLWVRRRAHVVVVCTRRRRRRLVLWWSECKK